MAKLIAKLRSIFLPYPQRTIEQRATVLLWSHRQHDVREHNYMKTHEESSDWKEVQQENERHAGIFE